MTTALSKVASIAALEAAWQSISKNKGSVNSWERTSADGTSVNSFRQNLDHELSLISRKILENKFTFSPLEPCFLPRPGKSERLICIPSITDRIVQRALLNELSPRDKAPAWLRNPLSYGFVPGNDRGVGNAAIQACSLRNQSPWVFKTDISKFFDNIPRQQLKDKVRTLIGKRSLYPLLDAAINCEVTPRTGGDERRLSAAGIKPGQGVRQGMPLSPFFANLFLYEFDKLILQRKIKMVRYADDLIFFAKSEKEAENIYAYIKNELNSRGLDIPNIAARDKTQIYAPHEGAEFLGISVELRNGHYSSMVTQAQFNKMRENYALISSLEELVQRKYDITQFNSALQARTSGYFSAYSFCANANDLYGHLIDWERSARTKVYKELGIDISKLNSAGKIFLGIEPAHRKSKK